MFDRFLKTTYPPDREDPHWRGVITSPRATRRDGATHIPLIRTLW